ncbi:MAG: DUF3800 domain-containing protein [Pseudomonadota bacterium]
MSDLHLYLDDSGTRNPDRNGGCDYDPERHDWFALGGIMVRSEDDAPTRQMYAEFCEKWGITYPLHSSDIRFQKGNFDWLKRVSISQLEQFHDALGSMLIEMPVTGIACVIDRPGYNERYLQKYGRDRWSLCKTAFSVLVERAAKVAIAEERRLRIFPERADKHADRWLKGYFDSLRAKGMPFASSTSGKYAPLSQPVLHHTLREFRLKYKSSPLVQIADLYLYPMCRAGYGPYRPHSLLTKHGKLVDCHLSEADKSMLGIKYSCFDLVGKS